MSYDYLDLAMSALDRFESLRGIVEFGGALAAEADMLSFLKPQFAVTSEALLLHHKQHSQLRPDFDEEFMRAIMEAMIALEGATKAVLQETVAKWGASDQRVSLLVEGVRVKFENVTGMVNRDLSKISRYSQDAADAEQKAISFIAAVKEEARKLNRRRDFTEMELNRVKLAIKHEEDHMVPETRQERAEFLFFEWSNDVPNEEYNEQLDRIKSYKRKHVSLIIDYMVQSGSLLGTTVCRSWLKDLLIGVCEDENKLIDIKTSLQMTLIDVYNLENYVKTPSISFGPPDFIRCVVRLLRSEHVGRVAKRVDGGLPLRINGILDACELGLSVKGSERPHRVVYDDDDEFILPRPKVVEQPRSQILSFSMKIGDVS